MAKKNPFDLIKKNTVDRVTAIDKSDIKDGVLKATEFIGDKAMDIKDISSVIL